MLRAEKKKRPFTASELGWRAAMAVAICAGAVSLCVATLLIMNYLQVTAINPLDNPEMQTLRQQLTQSSAPDEKLVAEIRTLDLIARRAFFSSQQQLRTGGYLLIASVIVLVAALRIAGRCRPRLPIPAETPPPERRYWLTRSRSRELLVFTGGLWLVAALAAAYFTNPGFSSATGKTGAEGTLSEMPSSGPQPSASPSWDVVRQNWPSFRGPGGIGVAFHTNVPTDWDLASGRNIRWTADVPLPGANSPVVWENRIYLSGATVDAREVFCFDADSGALLWQYALQRMPGTPEKPPKISEDTGYAAPTLAVQGNQVFGLFGNGDLVSLDAEGKLLWGRNLGVPNNHYGHSSSLLVYENLLFVQYDQKKDGKLLALKLEDGQEAWTAPRGVISWASPVCVETPFGWELVLNSSADMAGYDPQSGRLLWQMECLDGEVATSPAYGAGMFFAANDMATATAVRLTGDASAQTPEKAWEWDETLPDVASPLGTDRHFYLATSRGDLVCLDAATGETVWLQECEEGFYASPVLVGDRVYAFDKAGAALIFGTGDAYELVGSPRLGEETFATPAFMDGRIYVRTQEHLVCIAAS